MVKTKRHVRRPRRKPAAALVPKPQTRTYDVTKIMQTVREAGGINYMLEKLREVLYNLQNAIDGLADQTDNVHAIAKVQGLFRELQEYVTVIQTYIELTQKVVETAKYAAPVFEWCGVNVNEHLQSVSTLLDA